MGIYVEEVHATFEMLAKVLNLPDYVKIVGITEQEIKGCFKIRLASEKSLDGEYSLNDMTNLGEMFANPEKYKVCNKGQMVGNGITYCSTCPMCGSHNLKACEGTYMFYAPSILAPFEIEKASWWHCFSCSQDILPPSLDQAIDEKVRFQQEG